MTSISTRLQQRNCQLHIASVSAAMKSSTAARAVPPSGPASVGAVPSPAPSCAPSPSVGPSPLASAHGGAPCGASVQAAPASAARTAVAVSGARGTSGNYSVSR